MSLRIGTLTDRNPLLKIGPYGIGRNERKARGKERKKMHERKKGRKEEKGRKRKRKEKKEKGNKEREKIDQSVDRSSQAGNFSISWADARQYLFQEGTKAVFSCIFSSVFRSTSVCFVWYLTLPSLVLRPD